jgi:hypothetical protein
VTGIKLAEDRFNVFPREVHNQSVFGDIPVIVQVDKIISQAGREGEPGDSQDKTDGEDDLSLSHFSMALFYLSGDRISHFRLKDHFLSVKLRNSSRKT